MPPLSIVCEWQKGQGCCRDDVMRDARPPDTMCEKKCARISKYFSQKVCNFCHKQFYSNASFVCNAF